METNNNIKTNEISLCDEDTYSKNEIVKRSKINIKNDNNINHSINASEIMIEISYVNCILDEYYNKIIDEINLSNKKNNNYIEEIELLKNTIDDSNLSLFFIRSTCV